VAEDEITEVIDDSGFVREYGGIGEGEGGEEIEGVNSCCGNNRRIPPILVVGW
jgi:hypothetical protein